MVETHVANWKKEKVQDILNTIMSKPVIGVVETKGIPGPQLQDMRRMMRDHGSFIISKNNFIALALKESTGKKQNIEVLIEKMGSQNALVATDMNPFKLYKTMVKTRKKTPAKGGEIAPEDIEIKAGDTPFPPGPIVGDLQRSGIPAAIERGKVVIKKDKVLVKKGEPIPREVASSLTRLEIYPLEVGLELMAAYEDGTIFTSDVLAIDEEEFMGDFHSAISSAFNVACFIGYTTPQTIVPLVRKAHSEAFNVAIFAGITNPETIKFLISKAGSQMISLASQLKDGLDDDIKSMLSNVPKPSGGGAGGSGAKKEETKPEEKEEEVSEEEAAAGLGALFG